VSKHVSVRCRRRDCRGCGRWWAHDNRVKLKAGLGAYAGLTTLTDITAPGRDVLPYDPERPDRCLEGPVAAWNYLAPKKWRDLHRVATKRAKRAAGDAPWRVLAKVWQEQRRGALHLHLVLPYATEAEKAGSVAYVEALDENRERYGFGFVDRRLKVGSPASSASYIGRYVTEELAKCPQLPGHVVGVAQVLTTRSGVTVRSLRAARAEHARRSAAERDLTVERPAREQLVLATEIKRRARATTGRRRADPRASDPWGVGCTIEQLRAVWAPFLGDGAATVNEKGA
jgi:hypothetical protein